MPDEKMTRYLALQLSRKAGISIEAATQIVRQQEADEANAKAETRKQSTAIRQRRKQLRAEPAAVAKRKAIKEKSKKAMTYIQLLQGGAPGSGRKS